MRGGYRTKVFLATAGVAAAVLLVAALLIAVPLRRQTYERIERGLVSAARLAAELLSHHVTATTAADLQDEARALARDIDARVTLIAADGRVIGDSSQDEAGLAALENHAGRPEVIDARARGIGISSRFSATLGFDMLYVAAPVRHPSIAVVRLALPLTEIDRQLETIWRAAAYALAVSVVGAFAMAWISSALLVRRLNRLAIGARRYADGEASAPPADYEDDEIGTVARVLDEAVRRLGDRAADLARDRARMEAILAGMVEGVLVLDAEGRVQLVNDAATRMLRVTGDLMRRHYVECVRNPAVVAQLDAAIRRDAARDEEPLIVDEGGRVFVARAAPVGSDEDRGAVLVLHDITDLHRADRIRRDFVANVSHELRTPLTAISGYLEALRDEPVGSDDRRRFLEIIARHTARMERLTKDLLRLARLEAGQEPPDYEPCSLHDLFAAVVADLRPKLDEKGQRVHVNTDAAIGSMVTDPQMLQDAVRNLVENAVIYSPAGSVITVTAGLRSGGIAILVADQGPGIPSSDLLRIFEHFYRVDAARSRESGGTGLGLSIVKHIVERLDGSVRAENRAGGGAEFTILLPLVPAVHIIES
jgi:two-component system phosphate regulon sensor histidine kinase PhoR